MGWETRVRGGGGNFGIVTGFTFRTSPVSTVATYSVQWPWESAAAALQAWQAWAPVAPDELFSVFRLQATGAKGPAERPRVASTGQLFGSEAELRSLLAPLTDAAEPSLLNVTSRSYIQAVRHRSSAVDGHGGGREAACEQGFFPAVGFGAVCLRRPVAGRGCQAGSRAVIRGGGSTSRAARMACWASVGWVVCWTAPAAP